MGKKKKFIDKKNAVTFRLVHRSQRDPLVTDDKAPQHVLQQIKDEKRDEFREKFGIDYDEDYDYLQHFKERGCAVEMVETPAIVGNKEKKPAIKLSLPSSVFPFDLEEKVGVLNKAAPKSGLQLDLDPDVVAGLDEDFDFDDPENILEDDFIQLANATPDGSDNEVDGYDDNDELGGFDSDEDKFHFEETKSRFTEYSMTSAVIRRNEQLTLLDDRFEQMYKQYDENEIGALDCDEIEGDLDNKDEMLDSVIQQYEDTHITEPLKIDHSLISNMNDSSSSDSETSVIELREKEKWDCESILSTYSTIYNHPKLIDAPPSARIRISERTGIPITTERLTASTLAKLEDKDESRKNRATGPGSLASAVTYLSIRPKGETPIDRLARKRAFKQHKKERRIEKKLNTEAFKQEKVLMEKMMARNKSKFQVPL